ncbi:hypothetical protein DASC09_038430 [Saccharomycopsis crataegensis]|uniref:Sec39 domain-containing protein n=1 Tax=Saccharomycopsis crataegensis TaxID=43959 RepID=A0AAV5QP09_9ASCO|nr:hypothetical protein DASC09_038430 [Saccharomycopsis crataegensis]
MDQLVEYKLFLSLAVSISKGDVSYILQTASSIAFNGSILSKYSVLTLLLILLPNSVEPGELHFIKKLIFDDFEYSGSFNYDDLISDKDLQGTHDLHLLADQSKVLMEYLNKEAQVYEWSPEKLNDNDQQKILFEFIKSRTLRISIFHNENVFYNGEMFSLLPSNYKPLNDWTLGILSPLDFTINYNISHGIPEQIPNLLSFHGSVSSKKNFDYLIKHMNHENINDFLIKSLVPYAKHNSCWNLFNEWLIEREFFSVDDYTVFLKFFEFFFNNYLVTQDQDDEVLNFLNQFIIDYVYKIYSSNLLTNNTLSIMSETLQYCIMNHEYFSKFHNDKKYINFEDDFDHSIIDDSYIKTHFCNNTLPNLQFLSSLIDSISKLINITNNNESLMSITQILLISISSSDIQLNFAKLLIHNFKINDDFSNKVTSYNNWESFLKNFNWLVQESVLFKKIQKVDCISKINEILFELLLSFNFTTLINKYLLINFNSNETLKKILLKYCWIHFVKADSFRLDSGELVMIVEFLKIFDSNFDKEIEDELNFFVKYKNNLDIYDSNSDSKFMEFDSSLVGNKKLSEFINSDSNLDQITNTARDFNLCDNLNFEIVKFKKLFISLNQLVTNFKFLINNRYEFNPIDVYCINNPLLIMDKILELDSKVYTEVNKIYKIIIDLCIGMNKIGLIYDVSSFEHNNGAGSVETVLENFDDFKKYESFFDDNSQNGIDISASTQLSSHKFPLKDKLISSCINSSLIDLNFEFAYEHSMKLLNNETSSSLNSLGYIWLSIFQVCKFVDPMWLGSEFDDDEMSEVDDNIRIPLDILTKQIELISKLLEVVPSSTSISAVENKIILNQASYLLNKYHKKLNTQVVNDFNNYQYQQSTSIFRNFNASTGTLLNQFAKNASNINLNTTIGRRTHLNPDSINSSPISAFDSPRNSQIESIGAHHAISLPRNQGTPGSNANLENRFVRAFASSASELFKVDSEGEPQQQQSMSQSPSSKRINLLAGEEQIKNLFVSGLGWAIGANSQDANR